MSGTLGIAPVRIAWIDGVRRRLGAIAMRAAAVRSHGGLSVRWGVPVAIALTAVVVSGTVWATATWAPA